MPAETRPTNYGGGCYDNRSRRRNYHRAPRCYDNWCRRCDYEWPIRLTPSIWSAVKAATTSALGTGSLDAEE
jgi:hypothetical protein